MMHVLSINQVRSRRSSTASSCPSSRGECAPHNLVHNPGVDLVGCLCLVRLDGSQPRALTPERGETRAVCCDCGKARLPNEAPCPAAGRGVWRRCGRLPPIAPWYGVQPGIVTAVEGRAAPAGACDGLRTWRRQHVAHRGGSYCCVGDMRAGFACRGRCTPCNGKPRRWWYVLAAGSGRVRHRSHIVSVLTGFVLLPGCSSTQDGRLNCRHWTMV